MERKGIELESYVRLVLRKGIVIQNEIYFFHHIVESIVPQLLFFFFFLFFPYTPARPPSAAQCPHRLPPLTIHSASRCLDIVIVHMLVTHSGNPSHALLAKSTQPLASSAKASPYPSLLDVVTSFAPRSASFELRDSSDVLQIDLRSSANENPYSKIKIHTHTHYYCNEIGCRL